MLSAVTRSVLLFVALLFRFKIAAWSLLARTRAGAGGAGSERSSARLAERPEHKEKAPKAQTGLPDRLMPAAPGRGDSQAPAVYWGEQSCSDTAVLLLKQVVPRALRTTPA